MYKIIVTEDFQKYKLSPDTIVSKGKFYQSGQARYASFTYTGKIFKHPNAAIKKAQQMIDEGFKVKAVKVIETYEDIKL